MHIVRSNLKKLHSNHFYLYEPPKWRSCVISLILYCFLCSLLYAISSICLTKVASMYSAACLVMVYLFLCFHILNKGYYLVTLDRDKCSRIAHCSLSTVSKMSKLFQVFQFDPQTKVLSNFDHFIRNNYIFSNNS